MSSITARKEICQSRGRPLQAPVTLVRRMYDAYFWLGAQAHIHAGFAGARAAALDHEGPHQRPGA